MFNICALPLAAGAFWQYGVLPGNIGLLETLGHPRLRTVYNEWAFFFLRCSGGKTQIVVLFLVFLAKWRVPPKKIPIYSLWVMPFREQRGPSF